MTTTGHFTWYELLTNDIEAAQAFYTDAIGWKVRPAEDRRDYIVWSVGDRLVGGLRMLPEPARVQGAPPNWLGHVAVADVDATAKQAVELGGTVLGPVQQVPGSGRFALMRDGQGAVLSACAPGTIPETIAPAPDPMAPGHIAWHELHTTDCELAWTYYSQLFGWHETANMDNVPNVGTYRMFKSDRSPDSVGGMSNLARVPGVSTHWLYYITVSDVAATAERVASLGGKILTGPMTVVGGRLVALCEDAQGAAFALQQGANT